jgi:hypothetical protein
VTAIERLRAALDAPKLSPRETDVQLIAHALVELADRLDALELRTVGVVDPGLVDPSRSHEERIDDIEARARKPR